MWAEHWNPSICLETPHLWHLSSLLRIYLGLNVFLFSNSFSLYGACCWLTSFEYPMFLDLNLLFLNCFHLALFGGISVFWCLNRFTWVACGTLDIFLMCLVVDLEDSNFLASCLTLLAGNFSRSILESLIVSETNYSSIRKTKTCLCVVLAISCGCGYFARLIWACTVLYHSSTLISPCLKFVKWSNHALTSFVWDLQNSSNLFQITSKHKSSGASTRIHTGLFQNPLFRPQLSCIFLFLITLPVHNLVHFYIWFSIWGIYDTSCHPKSSPYLALLYMAYTLVTLLAFDLWMTG